MTRTSAHVTVRIEPKRYGSTLTLPASAPAREHDCERDATVEAEREREVARCAAVRAQPLDQRPRRRRRRRARSRSARPRASKPAATPANARWPRPSPISDMRFCTRNAPMSGAHAPTTSARDQRELHVLAVERPRHQPQTFQPERQVVGVDPEAHAACRELVRAGRRTARVRFSTIDTVEVVGDRAELVRHEQHRRAVLGREVHERVAEQPLRLGVDAGDRLVEHEQLGIADERLGDEHALLLAAGELAHAPAPQVGERDRLRARGRPRRGRAAPGQRHHPRRASRPARTTSSTVAGRSGGRCGRCGTYPIRPRSREHAGVLAEQRAPRPHSGRSTPSSSRSSVDLPLPFGPTSAANSPACTRNETSSSTGVAPYANETSSASTTTSRSGFRQRSPY